MNATVSESCVCLPHQLHVQRFELLGWVVVVLVDVCDVLC